MFALVLFAVCEVWPAVPEVDICELLFDFRAAKCADAELDYSFSNRRDNG